MKIAIVHDQLREFGGAERVLVELKKIYPTADIITSTFNPETLGSHKTLVKSWQVKTTWFGKIPIMNALYSPFRFLTPWIWESLDLSSYDLVISSTGSWMCKGVKTVKSTLHISYIHHPPRYLYGYETAIEWQKYWLIKIYGTVVNHFLRIWDFEASQRPNYLIANSEETRKRIQKFYRRDSVVIYPPVNIPAHFTNDQRPASPAGGPTTNDYFITVSRLARAKHIELLIRAANKAKIRLKVVGTGRDEKFLKSIADNTVELVGDVTDCELIKLYNGASAFLFASIDEEFGIAPIEAMGYGLPVIAYASGGLLETVHEGVNGYLYEQFDEDSLIEKINKLNSLSKNDYTQMRINARKESEKYTEEIFAKKIKQFVNQLTR